MGLPRGLGGKAHDDKDMGWAARIHLETLLHSKRIFTFIEVANGDLSPGFLLSIPSPAVTESLALNSPERAIVLPTDPSTRHLQAGGTRGSIKQVNRRTTPYMCIP